MKKYKATPDTIFPSGRVDTAKIIGRKFGRLTIIKYAGSIKTKAGRPVRTWECLCDCGNIIIVRTRELSLGKTKSCKCLLKEILDKAPGRNKKKFGESAFNQLFYMYLRRSRRDNIILTITIDDFKSLTQSNCYYCDKPPSLRVPTAKGTYGYYLYTGVDRIDNSKGYIAGNVRPCCKQCNIAKNVLSELEFIEWLQNISNNLLWKEAGNIVQWKKPSISL